MSDFDRHVRQATKMYLDSLGPRATVMTAADSAQARHSASWPSHRHTVSRSRCGLRWANSRHS
jgi:hypothetical protein